MWSRFLFVQLNWSDQHARSPEQSTKKRLEAGNDLRELYHLNYGAQR